MNQFFFRYFRLLFLIVLSALTIPFHSATAQSGLHLITSPLPINLITEPGSAVSTPIKIKNAGTDTEEIKVSLMKFKAYRSNGQPQLMDLEPGDTFLQWASFSEDTFSVAPDEWKTVTATFTVPEDAAFGYYYAIVFSRANDSQSVESQQTAVLGGTAVLVLLEARVDNAKRSIEVARFSTDKKIYEFLPATFTVRLSNTGNVHVSPRGNIFINKGDEHDIALLEINPNKGNILPDSTRDFKEVWSDGFPVYGEKQQDGKVVLDSAGNQSMELKWDFGQASKLRWGKYTAKMLLTYDDGTKDVPVEGEVSFWVVPWRLIGGACLMLIFILIGMKNALQSMRRTIRGWFERD